MGNLYRNKGSKWRHLTEGAAHRDLVIAVSELVFERTDDHLITLRQRDELNLSHVSLTF